MIKRISQYNKFLLAISVALFTVLLLSTSPTHTHALAESEVQGEYVEYFARERNIPTEKAREIIGWQERAGDLDDRLNKVLPTSDYGGIWINRSTGRINIGLVEDTNTMTLTKQKISSELEKLYLAEGADIVPVTYSQATLTETTETIHRLHQELVSDDKWPIQMGLKIDRNKVQVDIPEDSSRLLSGHRKVMSIIEEKYKNQVFYETYSKPPELEGCNWWFCDSPLRGGVGIKGNLYMSGNEIACTAGPILRDQDSGYKFLLTAGHCLDAGTSWSSETSNYSDRSIGTVFNSLYNNQNPIDAMIVRTSGTEFSSVSGAIFKRGGEEWSVLSGYNDAPPSNNEFYDMTTHSTSVVGQRICISPAITGGYPNEPRGGSCGEVEQTSVYWSADGVTTLVHRAGYCSRGGDSGSPIFGGSNNVKGVHRGANDGPSVCSHSKYYTPIGTILIGFANENIDLEVF